jgi:hypothetical protein
MKLGELRGAIRTFKGAVCIETVFGGKVITPTVQKTQFLNETLLAFGSNKGDETGLTFDPDSGLVRAEVAHDEEPPASLDVADTTAPVSTDLLLGEEEDTQASELLGGSPVDLLDVSSDVTPLSI